MPMSENMDMLKMQEEALRRAREMQSRSRLPREENPPAKKAPPAQNNLMRPRRGPSENTPMPPAALIAPPVEIAQAEEEISLEETPSLLDTMLEDKDKTLILTLLLLLSEDGADASNELLFGLMFLLM